MSNLFSRSFGVAHTASSCLLSLSPVPVWLRWLPNLPDNAYGLQQPRLLSYTSCPLCSMPQLLLAGDVFLQHVTVTSETSTVGVLIACCYVAIVLFQHLQLQEFIRVVICTHTAAQAGAQRMDH